MKIIVKQNIYLQHTTYCNHISNLGTEDHEDQYNIFEGKYIKEGEYV